MREPVEWLAEVTRAQLRSWRTRIWMILLAALATGLTFVPLFDVLGFEYAFAMAIAGSLAALDVAAAHTRRAVAAAVAARPIEQARPPGRTTLTLVVRAAGLGLLPLAAPFAIMALNALRVPNCDWWFGISTFVLMPVVSGILASVAGVVCGILTGPRRGIGNTLPPLLVALTVAAALWRFYAAPPVFSYSWLVGYFPGNLYDENIALGAPFYWARLEQIAWATAALGTLTLFLDVPALRVAIPLLGTRPSGGRLRATLLAIMAAGLGFWLTASAGRHGYAVDGDDIAAVLSGRRETDHFVIRFPPGGEIERDIDQIAADHEFRYAQVVRTLGTAPAGKITSFYFLDGEQKARLMGARNVYMAKPWRMEIYVNHEQFPHDVIRHEIAHVIAGAFGDPIFHVSAATVLGLPLRFNVGLIEGLAVAVDWPDHFDRALTPHQSVRALEMLGYAPPIDALLSTEFLTVSSARSYTTAGSFVRFLLDRHGAERLRVLYGSGGDFTLAYGASQRQLVTEWREMIAAQTLPPEVAEVVRERFRRQGIFSRPCPHAIAKATARAMELAGSGRPGEAVKLLRQVCRQAPEEPRYRLDLARLLASLESEPKAVEEAGGIWQAIAADARLSSSLRAEALSGMADMAARRGDWEATETHLEAARLLPLDDGPLRQVEAELFAVRHQGPAAKALRAYFFGPSGGPDPVAQMARAAAAAGAEPELGIAHYLIGRNLVGHGADAEAAAALGRALDLGLPSPRFTREAARRLAETGYAAGDDAAVERAAGILSGADQPEVERLYGADWRERLAWRKSGALPAAAAAGPAATPGPAAAPAAEPPALPSPAAAPAAEPPATPKGPGTQTPAGTQTPTAPATGTAATQAVPAAPTPAPAR